MDYFDIKVTEILSIIKGKVASIDRISNYLLNHQFNFGFRLSIFIFLRSKLIFIKKGL